MQRETSLSSQVVGDNSNNYKFCIHSDFVVVNSCGYFIARKRYKKSTNIEIHTIHKNKYKHKSWQWKRLLRAAPSEASDHQRSSDQFLGRKKIEGREREGNTPTRSGLLRRGADAGGRRSRGGMPTWSSRAEEQDDKQQDDLWKMKVIFGGCWKMSLADKTPWISEMRPSQLTTLNHATPRSPQPLQSRSHLGPGERPQPTKRGGGNNRCESAWTEQRRRHHCQAGNAHCHNKCHTYWNAQKSDKWILPRILHRTGVSINH